MPSPLSTNRAYTKYRRQPHSWRSSVGPIFVLLAGSAISFWQVHITWNELVTVQYNRKTSQTLLTEKEATLASESERIKALEDELQSVTAEVVARREELLNKQTEITSFKEDCERKRTKLKAENQQELDDVTWEARTAAWKRVQNLKDSNERDREQRAKGIVGPRAEYKELKAEQGAVHSALARVEMERLLYRMLGNTTDSYVEAYFDRVRRGVYQDSLSLNQEYLLRMTSHAQSGGLWYVDDEGDRASLGEIPEDLRELVPKQDYLGPQYPRGGVFRTCAVVGNSGVLLKYRLGEAIDAHDAVFRLNEAPTKGFEEYVGRKTTLRLVEDAKHAEARQQPSKQLVLQVVKSDRTLQEYLHYKAQPQAMNLHYMAPDFELHLSRYLLRPSPHGFLAAALAVQKCRRVTLYGFTANYRGHVQYNYFDKAEPAMRLRSAVGSQFDVQAYAVGMLAELAQRSNGTIRFAQPCVSAYHCFSSCVDCTELPLSHGGACSCDNPLPIAAPGFCAPPAGASHRDNCFHPCPGGAAQCPGGSTQKDCGKLGVDHSEKNPCR